MSYKILYRPKETITIKQRPGRLFGSFIEAVTYYATADVELLTPEEATLKEAERTARIEEARLKLFASLITTLTPVLSGLTSFVDDTLTTIKKQTIKLTTHNRLIISK